MGKILRIGSLIETPQKGGDIDQAHQAHQAHQAKPKKKVFTSMNDILSFFDKEKTYTKDEALRLIGLVSNYSTRQVYDVYERLVFEGAIKIQKNINR